MCCLKYENDEYEEAKERLPDLGEMIVTPARKRESGWHKYFENVYSKLK